MAGNGPPQPAPEGNDPSTAPGWSTEPLSQNANQELDTFDDVPASEADRIMLKKLHTRILTRKHITPESYCVLCRDTIPIGLTRDTSPTSAPWARDIICFYEVSTPNGPSKFLLNRVSIGPDSEGAEIDCEAMEEELLSHYNKIICYDYPSCWNCSLENTMNMVHVHCLQLAKLRLNKISISLLIRTARILRPIVSWKTFQYLHDGEPKIPQLPESNVYQTTTLGQLLTNIHLYLPPEIQRMISGYLHHTLFISITSCLEVLDWVGANRALIDAEVVHWPYPRCPLISNSSPKRLIAKSLNVLGEVCLTVISDGLPTTDGLEISLKEAAICGVNYALGLYGLVGLKVLYEDGSSSPWLGCSTGRLFRTVRTQALQDIYVSSDGHKLLSLDNGTVARKEKELTDKTVMDRLLWSSVGFSLTTGEAPPGDSVMHRVFRHIVADQPDNEVPPGRSEFSIVFWKQNLEFTPFEVNTFLRIGARADSIRGSPGAYVGEYLRFQPTDQQERSLTVGASELLTFFIQAGDDPSQSLGKRHELADVTITMYLYPGETVKSIRLVARLNPEPPFFFERSEDHEQIVVDHHLLMETSHGRLLFFGPHGNLCLNNYCIIKPGEESDGVSGIFVDGVVTMSNGLESFGVTSVFDRPQQPVQQEPPGPLPHKLALTIPIPTRFFNGDMVLSKANLCNLKEIKVQMVGDFCAGLRIYRHDGKIDVLGTWIPHAKDDQYILYEEGNKPLRAITFVFRDDFEGDREGDRHVSKITTEKLESSSNTFIWEYPFEEVAWWYSAYKNYVEYWDGDMTEIQLPIYNIKRARVE